MRTKALPTIKNKEAALRVEVKKAKAEMRDLQKQFDTKINSGGNYTKMWNEFLPNLMSIAKVKVSSKKIAGVKIPLLKEVVYHEEEFSLFGRPKWFPEGIAFVKELTALVVEKDFATNKMELLAYARRKTTQKVNLYEKVQIPGYQAAILKIKRFLEDEENLSKSAQKIVKKRQQQLEEEAV